MPDTTVTVSVQGGCGAKPHIANQMLTDCPLLDVAVNNAEIEDVCTLGCGHLSPDNTTDPCYVFRILECCQKLEGCLQAWYGTQVLDRITKRCTLSYTGNISAQTVVVDLDFCRLDFEGFSIQCDGQTPLSF